VILCVSHSFSVWLLPEFRIGRYFFTGGTTQEPRTVPEEGTVDTWPRQFRFFGSRLRVLKRWEYQTSLPFCSLFPKEFFVKMSQSLKLPRNGKLKNGFRRSPTSAKKQTDNAGELRFLPKALSSKRKECGQVEFEGSGTYSSVLFHLVYPDGSKSIKFLSIKNQVQTSPKSPNF